MFTGKLAVLKNLLYLIIIGLHIFLLAYFLYNEFLNYLLRIINSISFSCLIGLALYTFITNKSYYYYFYIGIIISSTPIIFIVHLGAILIVPELIILSILLFRGLEQGSNYYKMRVDKKANIFQHDPAVTHLRTGVYAPMAFKMDEVWNPDSSIPLKSEDKILEKKTFSVKIQLISFILTLICFILSVISDYTFYI